MYVMKDSVSHFFHEEWLKTCLLPHEFKVHVLQAITNKCKNSSLSGPVVCTVQSNIVGRVVIPMPSPHNISSRYIAHDLRTLIRTEWNSEFG